jgi:cyclic beta-1,2-glucan synthetase
MTDGVHFESLEVAFASQQAAGKERALADGAMECARAMVWVPGAKSSRHFAERRKRLNEKLQTVFAAIHLAPNGGAAGEKQKWLRENTEFLRSQLARLGERGNELTRTEHVRSTPTSTRTVPGGEPVVPRSLVIAEDLLSRLNYRFDDAAFSAYLSAFQSVVVLRLRELWEIVSALTLVLLERIAESAATEPGEWMTPDATAISTCITSLRETEQTPWNELLEWLIVFDEVLRRDPAGAYPRMETGSREAYRQEVVRLAKHSDYTELEIAEMALSLARQAQRKRERDPRVVPRQAHVGYYLVAEGRELLYRAANVRLPFRERLQEFLRRHPDEFYFSGIEILTASMILAILWRINFSSLWSALFAAIVLLIPCSQGAMEIMNSLTTSLLEPRVLPKLDFSEGIPEDCTTMVVVPTLLLNEAQVRQLVRSLEVRYVANRGANLHFALLTDLADAAEQPREDDPLVELCGGLIRDLNRKYAGRGTGAFFMFHRHRVYNRSEGVWMGWERKRGKLLDFNKLILDEYDSFPYKVGDLAVLSRVRYVLTLDSDTELPRGAARRLIGTLAHPLCQAVIDTERNVVTRGYGILQPRVGVSVESVAQSRLASIYSGRTGLDIYTHAVSDVYQDLYDEGIFVGKGIYDVRTVHRVLDHRFPRNSILSHDLIEGAYTRAGLVSDIELIDHYPSHYSAYVRRKHRWVRGDWQIMEWLFSHVPDESRRRVPNPISVVSRWKILDNLRRSVVEPATLALFLLAWTVLPAQPLYWTLAALGILVLPTMFQFVSGLIRGAIGGRFDALKEACAAFAAALAGVLLGLAFLLHDALVSTDAIWRSLYRRVISRQRLLEWETAAEAEVGNRKRTPLDLYLLATPAIAAAVAMGLFFDGAPGSRPWFSGDNLGWHRPAFWIALPILALWAGSKLISLWLDRPPRVVRQQPSRGDEIFLRKTALLTWRYFAELSNGEHNWLIPDNIQEEPAQVAARVSPTNLGMLLNARQVACELGYLTVPELVRQTRRTLWTMNRLECYRGHLLNWYDTRTLTPLPPLFVSTVDSGNLAAAFITLKNGCAALLEQPLLSPALLQGCEDHMRVLAGMKALSPSSVRRTCRAWRKQPLLQRLLTATSDSEIEKENSELDADALWFATQLRVRRQELRKLLKDYLPWLLPEFELVRSRIGIGAASGLDIPLLRLPEFLQELQTRCSVCVAGSRSAEERERCEELSALLAGAYWKTTALIRELEFVSAEAERWLERMDFSFLLNRRRRLLSIGYEVGAEKLLGACYDLLASESRLAAFVAVAKGDIPQDAWFRLGRSHGPSRGGPALVSWAGTMFEYLMPAIWMKSYRDTILESSLENAVAAQQAYAGEKGVPWGISESGYCQQGDDGAYQYRAFGIPELALQSQEFQSQEFQSKESLRVVVAPYATALALAVDPAGAVANLQHIAKCRCLGRFGFYEAMDFGSGDRLRLVKSWMAHHEGMTLLAIANFLRADVVRRWFHADVCVEATELLLQEQRILRHVRRAWHTRPPKVPARTPMLPQGELALES